jgi:hypothetical protein
MTAASCCLICLLVYELMTPLVLRFSVLNMITLLDLDTRWVFFKTVVTRWVFLQAVVCSAMPFDADLGI